MVAGYFIGGLAAVYGFIQLIEGVTGKKLTFAEEVWMFSHPHLVPAIWSATNEAFSREKAIFSVNGEDDEGDAFRHCIWSAMLARDIGSSDAAQYTSLHEQKPGTPAERKNMDLHNNAVGRWAYFNPTTNDNMQREILTMIAKGKLLIWKSNPGKKLLVVYYAKLKESSN